MKYINSLFVVCMLFFAGCNSFRQQNTLRNVNWPMPQQPIINKVEFKNVEDGLFLDQINSYHLLLNIEQKDAYIKNLEELIKTMKVFYRAKP